MLLLFYLPYVSFLSSIYLNERTWYMLKAYMSMSMVVVHGHGGE